MKLVTGNKNKFKEYKQILPELESVDISIEEIQGSAHEIVLHKIREAYAKLNEPCFVDDVSLEFTEWGKMPGPYIKYFIKNVGTENFHALLSDCSATARCLIGYKDKDSEHVFEGVVRGTIVKPTIDNGFGFDPVFLPDGFDKTYAQMSPEVKNKVSHRGLALAKLKEFFE